MTALALVSPVPQRDPDTEVRTPDEAVAWVRRRLKWELRLERLRRESEREIAPLPKPGK